LPFVGTGTFGTDKLEIVWVVVPLADAVLTFPMARMKLTSMATIVRMVMDSLVNCMAVLPSSSAGFTHSNSCEKGVFQ
jgi:hypothetical protein